MKDDLRTLKKAVLMLSELTLKGCDNVGGAFRDNCQCTSCELYRTMILLEDELDETEEVQP